eukprot:gene4177-59136_t
MTLAFAWGEWGEFSFLIATIAGEPIMTKDTIAEEAEKDIEEAIHDTADTGHRHH